MERKILLTVLIALTLGCLGLLAWVLALTGSNPLWAVVLGLVLFCIVAIAYIVARLYARRSAQKLERGLVEQGNAQLRGTRPDRRHETEQLQSNFLRAVRDLKSSKLGRGRDALYALPWYAIIGPSGAGKTTALRNSGLRFPSMRGQENVKVRGVGGTRNCDFWLTNDAVLLDTAGRWSTQPDDQAEWLAFLQLLRKHRTRKPLNGLIAAIGVSDVVNGSEPEIDALAQRMRERLLEVSSELRLSIPVYVLFTKCDLLEGFVETFGGLRATEREQIFGFTVPLAQAQRSADRLFHEQFSELAEALRPAALSRMSEERGIRERQLVFAFPSQFSAMQRNLNRFVARLFEHNVYQETLPLRGVYFSSGTQEGRPFSLLAEPRSQGTSVELTDQKGYFLRELFMHVVFEDREIASASQSELVRRYRRRLVLSTALSFLSVVLGIVPASGYFRSVQQLRATSQRVADIDNGPNSLAADVPRMSPVLQGLLHDLKGYQGAAPAWLSSLGMYSGDRVLPVLTRYVASLVRSELVRPLVAHDLRSLADFGLRYAALPHQLPTPAEHAAMYEALKLHLLLSEPTLSSSYATWVSQQLAGRWQEPLGRSATALAADYTRDSQRYRELAFTQDSDVVQRVRGVLNRASAAQQALDAIVAHVGTLGYDLDLPKLAGYAPALTGSRRVRGAFTRRGWESSVRELFATGASDHVDELWVLGQTVASKAGDRRARLGELENLYFRAYIGEWRAFLDGVRTKAPRNSGSDALALLSELTSGEPTPLARLFGGVYDNVHLPVPPTAAGALQTALDTATQKAGGGVLARVWERAPADAAKVVAGKISEPPLDASRVAQAFEGFTAFGVATDSDAASKGRVPVPFDAYREQLSYLRDALQLSADNPGERAQLESRIQTAHVRVRGLIDSQPAAWRPVFEALFWPPIRGLSDSAGQESAAWTGQQWCSQVVEPFLQTLLGRYPFSAHGRDARLDDFDAFYRPADGTLWKFTAGTLNDLVQLSGSEYQYTPRFADGGGRYSRALLEFLNRSRSIATAFYPGGSGRGPRIDFSVRIHAASTRVETTSFSVGGARITYDNGPLRWQTLSWPGPDPNRGASFSLYGRSIRAGNDVPGPWGLFRLLETGELQRSGDDTLRVQWRMPADDLVVWLELRPTRTDVSWLDSDQRASQLRLLRLLRGGNATVPHRISNPPSRVCAMKWPRWTRLAALPSLAAVDAILPPSAAGLCGKLPGSADFVRALPAGSAAAALDAWLVEACAQLGTTDMQQALGSVAFCFCVPARTRAVLGVLEPSRDSRGRAFPVALFVECGLASWRAKPASMWQAAATFRTAARAALANLGAGTAPELEQALGQLPLLTATEGQTPNEAASTPVREFLHTTLGASRADAMFYALQAFAAACADPTAAGSLVLDCPLRDSDDVARWLVLAGELSAHTHQAWSAFQLPAHARLFLVRGEPLPELLRLASEANVEHPRVWPLTTSDELAPARARAQLAGVLPELLSPTSALDLSTLGRRLAQHFSPR